MFKRFVNNQALLNGLKHIKRSDNNEQQQIVVAGNQTTGLIVPIGATSNKIGIELQEFCNTLVPTDSAIFKIAKQICAEQGNRIKEIAHEVLKDSGLGTNINNSNINSSNTKNSSNVKISSTPSLTHNSQPTVIISEQQVETKTPTQPIVKKHGKFYGTNKIFLLDEEEIVNISSIPTSNTTPIIGNFETNDGDIHSTQSSQSLNLDIVKRLLSDIFGKLKYLAMVLLNSLFGNRQNVQPDAATTQVAAQSLVLVISFMIYNIVAESSSADLHQDILLVFQEYLSNHLNN
ncbi:predicted protein [Naegleria gruberi]|uniref:Predicted protein n=1 Tax=Naegleria gruberi TaxID=5762 RepID=D2UYE5_NAEGR|nr:uncharacterized protein NAEGRDRAFT_45156 [Naegleria gruberi]EFC50461.1 predicted protein [Naegleria gruberi]|eukprot:XP_002683205.1 predicted protein [Naegleria gruberi strain NEG-M]